MTDRVILAVKYTPVRSPAQLRKAVGGFLRYIHYRDKHADLEPTPEQPVEGLLKYVLHRDRASSSRGRVFGPQGAAGDQERRQLAEFVARSVRESAPQLQRTADGKLVDRRRAVYRFVLSPEHAAGLDLHRLTRATVAQLEKDSGGGLRWIAAEHRNTAHPHVHLVVAAMRETAPGRFRSVVLTRSRLARMKETLAQDLQQQRVANPRTPQVEPAALAQPRRVRQAGRGLANEAQVAPIERSSRPARRRTVQRRRGSERARPLPRPARYRTNQLLSQLAAHYRRDAERLASEQRWAEHERGAWER